MAVSSAQSAPTTARPPIALLDEIHEYKTRVVVDMIRAAPEVVATRLGELAARFNIVGVAFDPYLSAIIE
ncbi:hypothetical protein Q1J45_11540 [Pseudomonas rhodesiae]|uniref:hypothetical protein n=1 Tax=unclassified Pseudomonas TaxID=196821 RepID=UPI002732A1CA|nr:MULTISPECIES: hypothetical protein [unclassified Pseudomonas]WLH42415.1 hypothetical protein PSH94_07570 [Pseudomonas sp. FP2254]